MSLPTLSEYFSSTFVSIWIKARSLDSKTEGSYFESIKLWQKYTENPLKNWWLTKDGDVTCLALYEKHYSARTYKDGRKRTQFVGPGEKVVLRSAAGDALFVWRNFLDDCIDERTGRPQEGINCAAFRNEGTHRSSGLIREADAIADCLWPDCRHYTYVDPKELRSGLPGSCFLMAGWKYVRVRGHRVRTKSGKLILERRAQF